MDSTVPTPPTVIAAGLVLILEVVSVIATLFLLYVVYLIVSDSARKSPRPDHRKRAVFGSGFLILIALSLWLIHRQAHTKGVSVTAATLFGSMAVCAIYYFSLVRRSWEDDRIRYTLLLWATFWLLTGLLLVVLGRTGDHIKFQLAAIDAQSFAQYVNTFAQVAGIIIAATMVIVTNRHNAKELDDTARQRIYQTLELESVALFRFECDHPELVQMLWYPESKAQAFSGAQAVSGAQVPRQTSSGGDDPCRRTMDPQVKRYQLKQYTCQILNLFEMATRFRKQDIMEAEIFGSWVIWMWELCSEPVFQSQWHGEDGIEFNYVAELREIINAGVYFATDRPGQADASARKRAFFRFVGHAANDEHHVRRWLDQTTADTAKFKPYWDDGATGTVAASA